MVPSRNLGTRLLIVILFDMLRLLDPNLCLASLINVTTLFVWWQSSMLLLANAMCWLLCLNSPPFSLCLSRVTRPDNAGRDVTSELVVLAKSLLPVMVRRHYKM